MSRDSQKKRRPATPKPTMVMTSPIMMRANTGHHQSKGSSRILLEVLRVATRGRATLPSVLRTQSRRPVGPIGRGGHLEEADLPDLHARVEGDRKVRHVGEFE